MMHTLKLSDDARVACLLDESGSVLMALTGGRNKLVLTMPGGIAASLRQQLEPIQEKPQAGRLVPPRYKWGDLMRRLNKNSMTAADHDALRDLLFHLGINEGKA